MEKKQGQNEASYTVSTAVTCQRKAGWFMTQVYSEIVLTAVGSRPLTSLTDTFSTPVTV